MIDFKVNKNVILSSLITGVYDVNRKETLKDDDFSVVAEWAKSIINLKLQGIIFHNNFSEATCKANESEFIRFVKVNYNPNFNPNVFRYFVYNNFFQENSHLLKNVFLTDVSDVIVLNNPFLEQLYLSNTNAIFCGDELEMLNNNWMKKHSGHLRSKIADYANYEASFKNETLLNCGVIGGKFEIMQAFINQLCTIHLNFNSDNTSAYTGDMGAFNYLIRTKYNDRVIHGAPINTEFKKYSENKSCWFKHK
jgi:hypothetical protein